MKNANFRLTKIILIITGSILLAVALVILFISPISYYLIKKYSEKYTGRQVKMDWIYVNPFTGYIHISKLKIYESKQGTYYMDGDSIFLSAKGLTANFTLRKLLAKNIEIKELILNEPDGIVIQNNKYFNFNDLILLFTPQKKDTIQKRGGFQFNLLHLTVINGVFHYREESVPIEYLIRQVKLESTGIKYNCDTIGVKFSFLSEFGEGSSTGNFTINIKTLDYHLATVIKKFDLNFIEQYLKTMMNYGVFRANLDADILARGNFNSQEDIFLKGQIALNDFHFGKSTKDDYASFDKLVIKLDALSPKKHQYLFDSVALFRPTLKYEIYDYLDNIQRMVGKKGYNISNTKANDTRYNLVLKIADYVTVLSKNFFKSDYKINKLVIYKANLKFNDYSLAEEFSLAADPLYIRSDSIDKNHHRVNVLFKTEIKPYGDVAINLSLNPKDSGDFDMTYHLNNLPLPLFNPYIVTYTSFPLDRGTISMNGKWKVRNSVITSDNHMLILDPRITKRVKSKDVKWIPANLIMFFVRERGNIIDYEVPITGNLKSPRFHIKDVILDILGNIFVKPATAPYRAEVKNVENEIEQSLSLRWDPRQISLFPDQQKFVDRMAVFLKNNPEAKISVYPLHYANKEEEAILFFEARKRFYLSLKDANHQKLTNEDSMEVEKMSVRNTRFIAYLNNQTADSMLFTVQSKCNRLIGDELLIKKNLQLMRARNEVFLSSFKKKEISNRVIVSKEESGIPYNGFSFYKIVYKGELPTGLINAYEQMNDLNNTAPRKWFKKAREKTEAEMKK